MRVDAAQTAEAMARELRLHARHHLAQGTVARGLQHRVDVAAVAHPRLLDESSAALRIRFVPHRQVRVDDRRGVSHVEPPRCSGMYLPPTLTEASTRRNYVRGNFGAVGWRDSLDD